MKRSPLQITLILLTVVSAMGVLASCSSRYKLDLYQTADEVRRKVKVEQTQYFRDARLVDPEADNKIVPGAGNVVMLRTGTRGETHKTGPYDMLGWDEYLRCEVYFQLPEAVTVDSLPLEGNSFVWVLGRYDRPRESRLFMPESGYLVVDSLPGNRLYGTLGGVYKNGDGVPLQFDGKFRVKIAE